MILQTTHALDIYKYDIIKKLDNKKDVQKLKEGMNFDYNFIFQKLTDHENQFVPDISFGIQLYFLMEERNQIQKQ